MHTWHIDIEAFFSPWHQGLYSSVEHLFSIVCSQNGLLHVRLSICPTMALWHRGTLSVSCVCSQEVRACITSVPIANCLPTRCLLRGPKTWKSLGHIVPTRLMTSYSAMAGSLWTTLPVGVILHSDFHLFVPVKKHLAYSRHWQEMSCHLLATDTWHWYLQSQVRNLGVTNA